MMLLKSASKSRSSNGHPIRPAPKEKKAAPCIPDCQQVQCTDLRYCPGSSDLPYMMVIHDQKNQDRCKLILKLAQIRSYCSIWPDGFYKLF